MRHLSRAHLHKRPRRFAAGIRRAVAGVAALGLAATAVSAVASASAADTPSITPAAVDAYGVGDLSGAVIGWQGSMRTSGGAVVFCIDPGTDFPAGNDSLEGYRTSVKGVKGDLLAGINRALHSVDEKSDRDAAALNFVIKHVIDPDAMYRTHSYPRSGSWPAGNLGKYIEWVLSTTYPNEAGGWRAVRDRALDLLDLVENTKAATASPTPGKGELVFAVNDENNYKGTVVMNGTANATGSITLTNGVFADTGKATRSGVKEGEKYAIQGVPTSDGKPYKISGTGEFSTGGTAGYLAEVQLWSNPKQNMVAKGRKVAPEPFTVKGSDPTSRLSTFAPVLTSQAADFAKNGTLTDTLTFSVATVDGVKNPWASDEDGYLEVGFKVTAYGPYAAPQKEVADAPADAPVAGTTTTLVAGPVKPVKVTIPGVEKGGFYTFVAEYDPVTTPAYTKLFLPKGYQWKHAFGMAEETTVAPMRVKLSSQVQAPEVALGGRGDDAVIVEADGHWLTTRDGAGNVPVVLTGQYIHLPSSLGEISPVAQLPEGASVVGTVRLTVTKPGTYYAKDATGFTGLAVPETAKGRMTWRWSVVEAEQPAAVRGFVKGSVELIGEPTQTQVIATPAIETKAQASTSPGETMTDTAIVSGTLPEDGLNLSFAAYNVPFGADGQPVWPGKVGDHSGFCTPENLVWDNHATPQLVTKPGEYTSPAVKADKYAMTLWVERGSSVPSSGEKPETIVEGVCGVPNETTYTLKVTTKARTTVGTTTVTPGEPLWDTVRLEGAIPEGSQVKVDLYQWEAGADAICTAKTLVWSSKPVKVTGGMFADGYEIDLSKHGQTYTVPELAEGTRLGFVETTTDAHGRIVSQGRCGEPDETVTVAHPAVGSVHTELAVTGGRNDNLPVLLAVAGGLIALGALGTVLTARRRRTQSDLTVQQ